MPRWGEDGGGFCGGQGCCSAAGEDFCEQDVWLTVVGGRAVSEFMKKTGAENTELFWAEKKKIQSRLHESVSVMRDF